MPLAARSARGVRRTGGERLVNRSARRVGTPFVDSPGPPGGGTGGTARVAVGRCTAGTATPLGATRDILVGPVTAVVVDFSHQQMLGL
jgi:hypothetical protein